MSLLILNAPSSWAAHPIRPLAQEHVVVGKSPNPATIPLYNPSIVRLDTGRLVASYMVSGKYDRNVKSTTHVLTSDDHGATWQSRHETSIGQTRLFTAADAVYMIGSSSPLYIQRSLDHGANWSDRSAIASGRWHQSATNFIHSKGNVYLALEKRINSEIDAWDPGDLAPVLMRAKTQDDLTKPESWTFSSELAFKDIIPGYRENNLDLDYFGVPFYAQKFPKSNILVRKPFNRNSAPMGWLETNVAQIKDPSHYWHDPTGRTFHLLMRSHTGGTGFANLAKVTENDDGTMTTSLETAPSGKQMLFLSLPGGQMRFHILYDAKTELYWMLGSQATDSMTRAEKLPPDRYSLPNNERHRLVLHFSKNLVDWCFAGLVAKGATASRARHYAAMTIDGDDLAILSRSGDEDARNAHDGNLITFHRVRDFRNLVY
ncbi:sialidase family protein [Novipirellula rosea]|uniref:Sialidase family protein n=1 Tax=Novipirellula rosea TaxID=1031540 RepID=A0ABP8N8F2_9BACT